MMRFIVRSGFIIAARQLKLLSGTKLPVLHDH